MSKKQFYSHESLDRLVKDNEGIELKYVLQPRWTGFNQNTIENIDFILCVLNKTGDTPFHQKEVYLMRLAEEINTLHEMLFPYNKLPYVMTKKQIRCRIDKLSDVFMNIYMNGGNGND